MTKTKIYIIIVFAVLLATMLGTIKVLNDKLKKEKAEKELYQKNTDVLMGRIQTYKANDSLNVVSIGKLELTLSEYKKYRADDLSLISDLKIDKKGWNKSPLSKPKPYMN